MKFPKKFFSKNKKKRDFKYYKKYYVILQVEFLIMFAIFIAVLYFNYDYLMFKLVMSNNYIYTETLDEIYKEQLDINPDGNYSKNFDDVAISLFVKQIQEKNNDEYTTLYLKGEFDEIQDEMKLEGEKSTVEKLTDDTIYCHLTNFSKSSYKIFKDNLSSLKEYDYIIIDLRDNPGGGLNFASKISSYFLDSGSLIATQKTRSELFTKSHNASTQDKLQYKHIYILQDSYTASAAEVMINALNENLANVTIIGETSYGKGIGQLEFNLTNEYGFKATVMQLYTPKGDTIHNIGIKPDIEYNKKDIINYTLELIKNIDNIS